MENDASIPDNSVVIPDTCMDIIFHIDAAANTVSGSFCGLDEHTHLVSGACCKTGTATFGIRFYAWTAFLFAEQDLKQSKNSGFPVEYYFQGLQRELEQQLLEINTLQERARLAERLLLQRIHSDIKETGFGKAHDIKANYKSTCFLNAVSYMLSNCGRARITDVCDYATVSEKQLERIFDSRMGVCPKTFSSLLRYQLVWQDMLLQPGFSVLDAVEKYGYVDQAHLLNDFKKRHLMTPKEAVAFARNNR